MLLIFLITQLLSTFYQRFSELLVYILECLSERKYFQSQVCMDIRSVLERLCQSLFLRLFPLTIQGLCGGVFWFLFCGGFLD